MDETPFDLELLSDCSTTLYYRRTVLEADIARLEALGYHVERIDGASRDAFVRDMTRAGRFQEQFGIRGPWDPENLDALLDALWSAGVEGARGIALVVSRFDVLLDSDRRLAEGLLDIVETASRDRLIEEIRTGKPQRLILLAQSDRGDLDLDKLPSVGALSPTWNDAESLDASRDVRERTSYRLDSAEEFASLDSRDWPRAAIAACRLAVAVSSVEDTSALDALRLVEEGRVDAAASESMHQLAIELEAAAYDAQEAGDESRYDSLFRQSRAVVALAFALSGEPDEAIYEAAYAVGTPAELMSRLTI